MALKFSMVLQAVDRVTAPARRVRSAVGGMVNGFRQLAQQVRRASQDVQSGARSLEFWQTRARRLRQVALERTFRAAAASARQLATNVRAGVRNLDLMGRAGRAAKSGMSWMWEKAAGLAKWGVAGAAAAGGLALFDMFGTASKFEQFGVMLTGIEGSADKARKSMAWVQDFAQKTPYELDDVMNAFVSLKAYGIDPMNGSLAALGDGAAGMSKPIDQAVEALADAVTGEYERLKEFGIRANAMGKQVAFSYMKNGKTISRQVKANAVEIEKAITGIFRDRFGGMMDRQSTTFAGIMSNLKDMWAKFLLMVANAGIFDKVKAKLGELYDRVNKLAQDGTLQAWAKKISDGLGRAFDWATNLIQKTDWAAFGRDLQKIAKAAWDIANGVADAVRAYQRWNAGNQARVYESTENGWFSSKQSREDARKKRQALEQEFGPLTGTGRSEQRNRAPAVSKPQASAGKVPVGGAVKVEVAFVGPLRGRVVTARSDNAAVPTIVNLGHSMGAPA